MAQSIKKARFFADGAGKDVFVFRIPNNTGDYVDVTNFGARICGIHVHSTDTSMESLINDKFSKEEFLKSSDAGCLFGGKIGKTLAKKAWEVSEEGSNFVLFSAKLEAGEVCDSELAVGVRVMWVNLNRLVLDYFITAKDECELSVESEIFVGSEKRSFALRSFCPAFIEGGEEKDIEGSAYSELAFVPFDKESELHICRSEEIKPMLELADRDGLLRLSAYSTLPIARVKADGEGVAFDFAGEKPEKLPAGASLVSRCILGIDYIEIPEEDDGEEPDPFEVFAEAAF